MKKIILFLVAGILAFGLIGCSGDLHDDEQSSGGSTDGSWYYISASNPAGTPTVIFLNSKKQTANKPLSVSTGNVFFKIDPSIEVEEEDFEEMKKRWGCEPLTEADAKALGWEDKNLAGLGIYCYAPFDPIKEGLSIYTHSPACFGAWPGKPMQNDDAALKTFNVNMEFTFDVTAYEAEVGKKIGTVFITGAAYSWQYPVNFVKWSDGNVTDNQFVSPASKTTLSYSVEAASFPAETGELQLVLFEEGVNAKAAAASDYLKQSTNFVAPAQDGSGTPYADFQNTRYQNGAVIPIMITVDAEGICTAAIK